MIARLPPILRNASADRPDAPAAVAFERDRRDTIEIALPAAMVARFVAMLADTVGSAAMPPDGAPPRDTTSPDAVERLLGSAIAGRDGSGSARVMRSPAGLYSPEYLRIAVTDADAIAIALVSRAARGMPGPA